MYFSSVFHRLENHRSTSSWRWTISAHRQVALVPRTSLACGWPPMMIPFTMRSVLVVVACHTVYLAAKHVAIDIYLFGSI